MNPDLKSQLANLRRRVRRVEKSVGSGPLRLPANGTFARYVQDWPRANLSAAQLADDMPLGDPEHYQAETLLDGEVVENSRGRYFLSEKLYAPHQRHGSMEISHLADLPGELLSAISRDDIPACDPTRWAFLDTETTGLAGGTGTCAFLIGVGTIEKTGFRVRLFFMRDFDEELAMLEGLADFLADYEVLVTYNGKAYDAPLLETRYRLARLPFPLEALHHLDLLHGARQLWKLRLESCRLADLEYEILGVEREGDLPGELIPYYYFEYLKTKQAFRLVPLFHHNVIDIVSLACLTAVVLPAFSAGGEAGLRHGADLLGLARWLRRSKQYESALRLYQRAIEAGLADSSLFAALWESALLEKKLARYEDSLLTLSDLAGVKNPYQQPALEELAKHREHRDKDFQTALEATEAALVIDSSPELLHRKRRLTRKLLKQTVADKSDSDEQLF